MAVASLAVPPEQHVVGGVEEEKRCARAGPVERVELLLRVREEQAAARVDHERDFLLAAFAGDLDRRRHQRRRKVVEGVVAEVLEDLHRLRFARAGESCDDDEVRLTRGGQSGRIHDRTTPTIEITIAPRNAARGPFTLNPSAGISETTYSISAPITKWKMPSVRQVIGAEMSSMIGLMNALTIPRTRPVRSSETYLSASPNPYVAFPQVMPGTKKAATAMATALISARQMIRIGETLNQYWASIPRRRIACSARAKTQRPSGYDTSVSPISTRYSSAGSKSGREPSACTRRMSMAYVVGSANAIGCSTPGRSVTGNAVPESIPNRKFAVSTKKFASRISSTSPASRYAIPTIARIAHRTAGSARNISSLSRSPRTQTPNAKSATCEIANQNRLPSTRPITSVSWCVGVSHVGSSVPVSISTRIENATPQKAIPIRPPMSPPKKIKPVRSSVPRVVASPTALPFTAKAAPNRNAGMMNW